MSSFAIFRTLLIYIQGEAHPLYVAERQLAPPPGTSFVNLRMGAGCLILGLLTLFALGSVATLTHTFIPLSSNIDTLTFPVLMVGWLVSLGWTVPLATFAGYAISRERATHTWDMLRVSPYNTEVILLTKAAASIRGVWASAVGVIMTVTLLRIIVIVALLVTAISASQLSPVILIILIPAVAVLIVIESVQEITLSVIVGVVVGLSNISPRMTMFIGMAGGFLIRLVQLAIVWWFLSHLVAVVAPEVALASTIGGSAIMLPAAPGNISLLLVLLLALGREGLVRVLLAWTLRRSQGE